MDAENGWLSERLAGMVPAGFFRPLARPSAPVYIDCADRLARSADEGGQVTHADAQTLIREVLAAHPQVQLEEDEGAALTDLRQRAGQLYNKLLEAGWLQERHVNLDERWVLLTPYLRRLLHLLGDLATEEMADLQDFTATLHSICSTLLADGALDPARLSPERFRQTVQELRDRIARATDQMHSVETLIDQQEKHQRSSESAAETLNRFLVEFHAGEHMVCYDALQKSGLLPRLQQARHAVQEAAANPFAKQRLAEALQARRKLSPSEAYVRAERMLRELERGLAAIPFKQRIIDGRMADFSRLSAQRYRYQTEIRGKRPEQVKTFMLQADALHQGGSFAELANAPGLELLSPEVALRFGTDALYRSRRVRPAVELGLEQPPGQEGDASAACDTIRQRSVYAITPQRAGKLVEKLLEEKGARLSSAEMKVESEEDLLDLLAMLAFDRASGSTPHKPLRWRVITSRHENGLEPDKIATDKVAGRRIERVTFERIA